MDIIDLITPWVTLLFVVLPLVAAERWIHQHMFGVGYLLTGDKGSATGFYYLIFFPAVVLHELVQYFVCGILNVPIKKLEVRLQPQENGTVRYDFVTIDKKKTDRIRISIVGGAPFFVAAIIFYLISTQILDLYSLIDAFNSSELRNVGGAIQDQFNTPDFWLWLYVLFALTNGMVPTREDREGWEFVLLAIGGVSVVFLVLGLDEVLIETYTGPIREGLELVTASLLIILSIDIVVILLLGITEDTLERIRGFKMDYSGPERVTKPRTSSGREPGSNTPIPRGELMPSVYNITLPLADPPARPDPRATIEEAAAEAGSARPPGA
jgi:hypothetical protein